MSVPDGDAVVVAGVRVTHPERVLFEELGLTKEALARYYESVASWMLPELKDRPLSLLPARVANDGRLSGIAVSQFEIQHGWIAIALSEDRPDRPAMTAARRG